MTHRFLIDPAQRVGHEVTFSAAQAHQIRRVLRLRAGDTVRAFDGVEPCDLVVRLVAADRGLIEGTAAQAAEPRTRLVVYSALLPREKFEQVLQKLTEVGAAEIVPLLTARGIVREAPDAARLVRWGAILGEAAEQSGRGRVPRLGHAQRLDSAVAAAAHAGQAIMAYEAERTRSLREALAGATPGPRTVSVFVGPEGGFEPAEAAMARAVGAELVTLGPRILRAETAAPVLAALVLYELGDLSSGPP